MRRTLTEAQKKIVAARDRWTCQGCGELLASTWQCDHIVPLCDGGADTIDNCQSLCVGCHAAKTQREAICRGERRRRLRSEARLQRHAPYQCTACGVVFSPFFRHVCESR